MMWIFEIFLHLIAVDAAAKTSQQGRLDLGDDAVAASSDHLQNGINISNLMFEHLDQFLYHKGDYRIHTGDYRIPADASPHLETILNRLSEPGIFTLKRPDSESCDVFITDLVSLVFSKLQEYKYTIPTNALDLVQRIIDREIADTPGDGPSTPPELVRRFTNGLTMFLTKGNLMILSTPANIARRFENLYSLKFAQFYSLEFAQSQMAVIDVKDSFKAERSHKTAIDISKEDPLTMQKEFLATLNNSQQSGFGGTSACVLPIPSALQSIVDNFARHEDPDTYMRGIEQQLAEPGNSITENIKQKLQEFLNSQAGDRRYRLELFSNHGEVAYRNCTSQAGPHGAANKALPYFHTDDIDEDIAGEIKEANNQLVGIFNFHILLPRATDEDPWKSALSNARNAQSQLCHMTQDDEIIFNQNTDASHGWFFMSASNKGHATAMKASKHAGATFPYLSLPDRSRPDVGEPSGRTSLEFRFRVDSQI